MKTAAQLAFVWPSTPPTAAPTAVRYRELPAFVARVRSAGLAVLKQLKALVDFAVQQEELIITDDDLPF